MDRRERLLIGGTGAALILVFVLLALSADLHHHIPRFLALYALAFAIYAGAVVAVARGAVRGPASWKLILAVAVLCRLVLVFATPQLSTDIYRYLWEGRVIAAGDIVPAKKPAPDIYTWALEKLGLEASGCIAFEDSGHGLRAAIGAGLKTIVVTNAYTADDDLAGAELVIDNWGTPGRGFKLLAGEAGIHTFLNLDLVREIHVREGE